MISHPGLVLSVALPSHVWLAPISSQKEKYPLLPFSTCFLGAAFKLFVFRFPPIAPIFIHGGFPDFPIVPWGPQGILSLHFQQL